MESAKISEQIKNNFWALCKEFASIYSQHSAVVDHTKLLTFKINTNNHPLMASKPYELALNINEWVCEEINALEKVGMTEKV